MVREHAYFNPCKHAMFHVDVGSDCVLLSWWWGRVSGGRRAYGMLELVFPGAPLCLLPFLQCNSS